MSYIDGKCLWGLNGNEEPSRILIISQKPWCQKSKNEVYILFGQNIETCQITFITIVNEIF